MKMNPLLSHLQRFHHFGHSNGTTDYLSSPDGRFGTILGSDLRQSLPRVEQVHGSSGTGAAASPRNEGCSTTVENATFDKGAKDILRDNSFAEPHQISLANQMRLSEGEDRAVRLVKMHEHPLVAFPQTAERRLEALRE